jgi:UDP-2,4-diacetamido-2,4,6-trideoxy-beta-L-altropyranose hydrolase
LKKVLFRIDGNRRLGMGHLARCIELANYFKKYGITSSFLFKENQLMKKIIGEKFLFFTLPILTSNKKELMETKKIIKNEEIDCIVIDQPNHKSKEFFNQINKLCKTIVIDNIDQTSFNANMLIYPWSDLEKFKKKLKPEFSIKLLSGSKYMMLGKHKKNTSIKRKENRIIISMGGADKLQFTEKIVKLFKKSKYKFDLVLVLGSFFKDSEKINKIIKNDNRFTIIENNENILTEMEKSTIGIFTFGLTAYESLHVGLPSIVFSHSKLNDTYGKILDSYNCVNYLGYYKNFDFKQIPLISKNLIQNNKLRKKFNEKGKKMIDGKGIDRIIQKIIKLVDEKD